jgi:membrane glycosyltransferase
MGVMSFVASPLWLCFLILTVMRAATADRFFADPASRTSGAVLFAIVMLMLLWPKIAALLAALRRPSQLAAFGGAAKTAASVFIETITSIITAPIMMLYHTYFVIAVFLRRSVSWDNQQRSESRVTLHEAIAAHALHTIVGLAAAVLIQLFAPTVLPWISPVLVGLIFSIPAAMLLGSRYVGLRLRHRRLLLIPEEFDAPPIIRRRQRHLARYLTATRRAPHAFLRAIADPALSKLHAQLLPSAAAGPEPIGQLEKLARVALAGGEAHLSRDDRMTIASDPLAMEWLHLQAWKEWPLPLLEQIALAAKNQKKK